MVISFISKKGGVGKSTFATNFACMSALEDKQTLLIDMDPQLSSASFREIRPDSVPQFQSVSVLNPTIHKDIGNFSFDIAYIDSGGRDSKLFRSAMIASDIVVIPVMPGQFDIWSLEDTIEVLNEVKTLREDLRAGIVINQVIPNTNVSMTAWKHLKDIAKENNIKLFDTLIHKRIGYVEASMKGMSVVEMNGKNFDKAKSELISLKKEVFNYV